MQMVMTSDDTQIQIFANWPISQAKRVTRDNRKNPEYRVVAAIRKLRTDTNCPARKSDRQTDRHLYLVIKLRVVPSVAKSNLLSTGALSTKIHYLHGKYYIKGTTTSI